MTEVSAVEVISSNSTRRPSNGETLINLVLDETGSMMSCYDATISSVNEYVTSQKNASGVAKCSLYTFSSNASFGGRTMRSFSLTADMKAARETGKNVRPVFENLAIAEVGALSRENYKPDGMTSLYDAIGVTIRNVEAQLAGAETVPNVLIVIITDGDENSSREYNLAAIKALIADKENEGWTFIYLGANQDAWSVAQTFGLSKGQAMSYDTAAMGSTMATLSAATTTYRGMRGVGAVADGMVSKNFFGDEEVK